MTGLPLDYLMGFLGDVLLTTVVLFAGAVALALPFAGVGYWLSKRR